MNGSSEISSVNISGVPLGEAGRIRVRTSTGRAPRQEGAILILALAYLLVIGLVVAFLSTWVSNDLNNSTNFSSANSLTVAASGMTDLAIQYVRYNPLITNDQPPGSLTPTENASPLVACWGGTSITLIPAIDGQQVAVWCSTVWQPLIAQTRTVTFYACPISVLAGACEASALLTATVTFDDYPPSPARSAPIQDLCTVFCGQGMTINLWQWGSFTTNNVTGVAASMTFSNEPSDTTAGASTQAAVTVKDSSGNLVAGDTVSLVQQIGPSSGTPAIPGISEPSSTLTATTNTSGVATFINIVPELAGNYTITAVDGSASALSTNFVVGKQRSVITPSTAPQKATQGGTPYVVTATASTGDVVAISDTTPSVCTLTGNSVTFKGPGTCTINFNDPATGNPNFSPALQVTQSFPVGGLTISQVGIALNSKTPGESATTNDQVIVTLENAVGATVTSTGTTTVILSDVASGFFSNTTGTAGTSTLTLTYTNGQSSKTVFFGGQTIGPDTISAINGQTIWGNASLTVVAGAPSQVIITANPTTPTVNSLTNTTLSLQLEDSGGNFTTATAATTLTLSAPTGFFATSAGTTGTSTLNVSFAIGAGTATAYIGNQTSGSDVITVKNGATVWTTSAVTFAAGAASKVLITLSPANPAKLTSTNATVTLQLEDQFGNFVHTSGVALTLTNSGAGYFATANGTRMSNSSASLVVTTNASGVATGSFGDATAQSDTITATGTGLSSTTPPFTV